LAAHLTKEELDARLAPLEQQHLLAFWDELEKAGQARLASQIAGIDLQQIAQLYTNAGTQQDWASLARRAEPPPALRLAEAQGTAACQRGEQALADGKIGVLIAAGGQGSRLGFDKPKGLFPIGPVSGASLLQIHLEKAKALAKRYHRSVAVYVMNSPATVAEQSEFLVENEYFGLPKDDLFLFCQGTMPAVDAQTGKLLLADKDRLFASPDGHGGTIAALAASGAIDHMRQRGVEHLFYLQVDNPLVPIGDAAFIGQHLLANSELTSIAVAKQDPADMVGNFVAVDDRVMVIEYSDFPLDVARQRNPDGTLRFWAGSIAIHMFDVSFLERSLALKNALPFHVARKKVPHVSPAGEIVEPQAPNALKFERFIFDLLPHARNALVVEYAEEDCFAPLKNAPGAPRDTPEYVRRMMVDQHRRWLIAAGVQVAEGVAVEISPLWAVNAGQVRQKVEPGMVIDEAIYLCE
jgi:UDP-N-acetylglucosamine/UDP-N-acetylgalactosamine diphosphorylase